MTLPFTVPPRTPVRTGIRVTAAIMAVLVSPTLPAQTASVTASVAAGSGAPAARQTVRLANPSTGFTAEAVTNEQGHAYFAAVPAGDGYVVAIDGQVVSTDIRLRANEARTVALPLPIASVVVTARRQTLAPNLTDAEVSAGLPGAELDVLPVEARDLSRALLRLPNVVPSTGFFPEAPEVSINGANGLFAQYLIDGLDNNENFLGGPKFPVPVGIVDDVTVLSSSYSAEYGRTGNGVVNVTTRSGTNEWRGEAFYLTRPGSSLDASSPYAGRDLSGNAVKDGFSRDQFGFALGGPIATDRTFFFVDAGYSRDVKDNLLSSPDLGVSDTVRGENRSLLLSGKIDHRINDSWRVAFRVNHGDVRIERQGGGLEGGITFPSAGSVQDRESTLAALSVIHDGGRLTSTTNLGLSRFAWDYGRALEAGGPQVTVNGPSGLAVAVLGDPGFVFDEREDSVQLTQKFTLEAGSHRFRFGADVLRGDFDLAGGGNAAGNYTVQLDAGELAQMRALARGTAYGIGDVPATAAVTSYSVELRPASFGRSQTLAALYVEDQVSLSARLTGTAGLRWDYDSLTKAGSADGDRDNIAPRLALNYRLNDQLAVRGGAGLFYERIPYAILSDALQQNTTSAAYRSQLQGLVALGRLPADTDLARVTFDGNLSVSPPCTTYLQCPSGATSAGLRDTTFANERRVLNPEGFDSPYTQQLSAGLQWQPRPDLVASADLIYARGYHQLRLRDLNAPAPFFPDVASLTATGIALLRAAPDAAARRALAESLGLIRSQAAADATRPVPIVTGGSRQIVVTETEGESEYRALTLRMTRDRGGDRYGYSLSYTLSKLTNNTDDLNFRSANSNLFDSEWGPSANDRRHVVSALLQLAPLPDVTVTLAALLQSGQPITYIPDASLYGTTDLNGDGASFSDAYLGNSDRAPGFARNSGRLPWSRTLDLGIRYAPRIGSGRVELSADVFNVLNANTLSGFANSATQSNQIQVAGQPFVQRNAGPPRQFQFGVRYLFD